MSVRLAQAASRGFLNGAGILALGIDVAVDELDDRHRRRVAVAEAGLQDARIAAVAVRIALGEHVEELLDDGLVLELRRWPGGGHAGRRACRA